MPSSAQRFLPTNPFAPVTKIFIPLPLSESKGREFVANILELEQLAFNLIDVEQLRIARIEFGEFRARYVALLEILVVIQAALVARDAVEVPHVDRVRAFLVREERFVHLLAVPDSDYADFVIRRMEELAYGARERLDCARGRFLDHNIARLRVLERVEHEIDRLFERHNKARHGRLGYRNRLAGANLIDKERNNGPARAHDVSVPRAADRRLFGRDRAALGDNDLLHHGLARSHGVDGVRRLVGRQADDFPNARVDRGGEYVFRAEDVRLNGLQRKELAAGDLLERGRVKDIVDVAHRGPNTRQIAHVANIEPQLVALFGHAALIKVPHVVLLLFVAREDADFANIGVQKTVENRVAKGARAARYEQRLIGKNTHHSVLFSALSQRAGRPPK